MLKPFTKIQIQNLTKIRIQNILNRAGYRMERLFKPVHPIDVFDLACRKAILERGLDFFFVQIGANDGVSHDPLQSLVREFGLSGLLIEPQPEPFARLRQNYAECTGLQFVNAAIACENGTATLYTIPSSAYLAERASFDRNLLSKHLPLGTPIDSLTVPALTLESVLISNNVRQIDLLQIDTEGFDYEVIRMLDFSLWQPSLIHYEHIHLSNADRNACELLLNSYGYRLHSAGQDTTALLQ